MKMIIVFSICLCGFSVPALGALTDADLNQIRLIVNDSEKRIKAEVKNDLAPINEKIERLDTRTQQIEKDVASLSGRVDGVEKLITWFMVIIVAIVGIPQVVVLWRSRKAETLEKQVEKLTAEIEALKKQRIVS